MFGTEMEVLKFFASISEDGRIALPELEKLKGRRAEIIIRPLEEEKELEDLLIASESSFDFWDNPVDDETWNE